MKKYKLSKEQEQVLREQVIDAERPGPVLRDFRTVLDFVGTNGVPAAGKHNLLPMGAIGDLNTRLSRPLHLDLKRPQLRSHPYLQGLHLLLRASGLTRVEGSGAKARLILDPVMLAAWDHLNPTEQFFTLLEAWLRFGKPEMIGERGGGFGNEPLFSCVQSWQSIPAGGQRFDLQRPQEAGLLGIWRNFYHLALMDLFGLLQVVLPSRSVQPWCPAGLKHTAFGDAVFTLIAAQAFPFSRYNLSEQENLNENEEEEEDGDEEDSTLESAFGQWQPLFQPYFPEWRNNLTLPASAFREGIFIFKVALGKVWRRIAIPASATLDHLVGSILHSVKFDDDHLYQFSYRDRFGAMVVVDHPYAEERPSTDEVLIGKLPLEPGQSMQLIYDFGDNWQFDVKLESIEPANKKIKAARILESHGKAPEQYPDWDG